MRGAPYLAFLSAVYLVQLVCAFTLPMVPALVAIIGLMLVEVGLLVYLEVKRFRREMRK